MTPLAHRVVKELTLPLKRRTYDDRIGLLGMMDDVHCFEVSEVIPAAKELATDLHKRPQQIGRLAFLPAPKTWIEWREPDGRAGVLLWEIRSHGDEPVCAYLYYAPNDFSSERTGLLELVGLLDGHAKPLSVSGQFLNSTSSFGEEITTCLLYGLLAMINTPRVIGRRQHMPHRGLERDLVRAMHPLGKFPLHAWTEIKLAVDVPHDVGGEGSVEAHLTGQRALHFCRAHLRIRLGHLEIVRGIGVAIRHSASSKAVTN
jgi:hypothetical protein